MKVWTTTVIPNPESLRERMMILAALDIMLCEEEWLRVHRYDPVWLRDMELGFIENGAGDHLYVMFTKEGVLMKGFDHESPLSPHAREDGKVWPGMYDEVPGKLLAFLRSNDESLEQEDVTFCLWRMKDDVEWKMGEWEGIGELDDNDTDGGAEFLLGYLEETPEAYADWAQDYYSEERTLPLEAISQIFEGAPVHKDLNKALNPERNAAEALDELEQIGIHVQR